MEVGFCLPLPVEMEVNICLPLPFVLSHQSGDHQIELSCEDMSALDISRVILTFVSGNDRTMLQSYTSGGHQPIMKTLILQQKIL